MEVDPEGARYRLGEARGHYESWFVRGNHPSRPLAFWVRYTVTSPDKRPQHAVAELFAIVFDGERGHHVVAREKFALGDAIFPTSGLAVRIGTSHLTRDAASGRATGHGTDAGTQTIAWDLAFEGGGEPFLLLPEKMYATALPRAKSLIIRPLITFKGSFTVGGEALSVDGWRGSLNHNWGSRHTDRYAWGQVMGFPEAPDTMIELITARIKLGPVLTPAMTPIILRHRGREHRLNAPTRLLGRAKIDGLAWTFHAKGEGIELRGSMRAAPLDVVTLWYGNPPGNDKICINTKIASCELELVTAEGTERLRTPHGAAFERLVDALPDAGVPNLPAPI